MGFSAKWYVPFKPRRLIKFTFPEVHTFEFSDLARAMRNWRKSFTRFKKRWSEGITLSKILIQRRRNKSVILKKRLTFESVKCLERARLCVVAVTRQQRCHCPREPVVPACPALCTPGRLRCGCGWASSGGWPPGDRSWTASWPRAHEMSGLSWNANTACTSPRSKENTRRSWRKQSSGESLADWRL